MFLNCLKRENYQLSVFWYYILQLKKMFELFTWLTSYVIYFIL